MNSLAAMLFWALPQIAVPAASSSRTVDLELEDLRCKEVKSEPLKKAHCTEDPVDAAASYRQINTPSALLSLAQRHYLMGNYDTAVDQFQLALKTLPSDDAAKITRETASYWVALSLFGTARKKESEKQLRQMVRRKAAVCSAGFECTAEDASTAPVVVALARALDDQRRWTEGSALISDYLKSHIAVPIRWGLELRLLLGNFFFRLQRTKQAYLEFARILRFYPDSAQSRWLHDHYADAEILKKYGSQVSSF